MEILLRTENKKKNILTTREVINKQTKIKKNNFVMELVLLRILDFDRNQLDI